MPLNLTPVDSPCSYERRTVPASQQFCVTNAVHQSTTPGGDAANPVTDAANPLATPASRTAAIISSGTVECTFEGRVIEDHFEHAQSFTYGLCRLAAAHRHGEHHARHLPAVHLVGAASRGPHDSPFEDGEELTLHVLPAAAVRAPSLRNSSSRRALVSSLDYGVTLEDAQAVSVEVRPSWELAGIGATVEQVVSRRHTAASRRRLSHGATRCGHHNKCVGPRKLLTVGMAYTGENFCSSSHEQTAAAIWDWNFAPLGPAPPRSSWTPEPDFGYYDALSTRFDQMCDPTRPKASHRIRPCTCSLPKRADSRQSLEPDVRVVVLLAGHGDSNHSTGRILRPSSSTWAHATQQSPRASRIR
mgnify:CR=1 FL=1